MPTPDGNSDPKRNLTSKQKVLLGTFGIIEAVMSFTNPDPTKDPYDAHLEKASKNPNVAPKRSEESLLEKRKVYEIEHFNWRKNERNNN